MNEMLPLFIMPLLVSTHSTHYTLAIVTTSAILPWNIYILIFILAGDCSVQSASLEKDEGGMTKFKSIFRVPVNIQLEMRGWDRDGVTNVAAAASHSVDTRL